MKYLKRINENSNFDHNLYLKPIVMTIDKISMNIEKKSIEMFNKDCIGRHDFVFKYKTNNIHDRIITYSNGVEYDIDKLMNFFNYESGNTRYIDDTLLEFIKINGIDINRLIVEFSCELEFTNRYIDNKEDIKGRILNLEKVYEICKLYENIEFSRPIKIIDPNNHTFEIKNILNIGNYIKNISNQFDTMKNINQE